VVDEHRLAAEADVRMAVRPAVAPAAPGRALLLGDADQHHPEAALALGPLEVGADGVLPRLTLAEAHQRHVVLGHEAIDLLDVGAPNPAQQRRRGIVKPRSSRKRTTWPSHISLGT
jgi:hypothetical protein